MSIFAVSAYVFFFAAAMGHDPAFTFCVLLAFVASLAAAAVVVLNRRYEPPARLPPAEIKVRPNYNSVRSDSPQRRRGGRWIREISLKGQGVLHPDAQHKRVRSTCSGVYS
ncbi:MULTISPECIES: hypothetical protein [unclassified Bradyrhizobium]|uniref:hypothetical protein n=1 Tax=unclassified Bradyrhizobium TaxID=2631580 RepID=UPI001CD5FB2B|nr:MULTISPECIES: hypothetical protein [unclassified Bradyrhizobium]